MNLPPIEQVPEFLRGKSVVFVRGAYVGDPQAGKALIDFWRNWMPPMMDSFAEMPFSLVGMVSADPEEPSAGTSTGAWMRDLSDATIDTLIRFALPTGMPAPITSTEIRHVGGAMGRADASAAAFGHRDASLLLQMVAITPTPEIQARVTEYAGAFKQALAPALANGVYMNFLEGEEALERTRDGFPPETLRRLKALKVQYDPANLFRHSYDFTSQA
jgi:hypothetical protein